MSLKQGPLSPHLQIYKPQLTSVLSITHRATGILLSLGALLFSFWIMSIAAGPSVYAAAMEHLSAWYGRLIVLCIMFSFYYHLSNGVRHLFWDMGRGLDIQTTYRSGYAVIVATVVLTLATWLMGAET